MKFLNSKEFQAKCRLSDGCFLGPARERQKTKAGDFFLESTGTDDRSQTLDLYGDLPIQERCGLVISLKIRWLKISSPSPSLLFFKTW